MAETNNYIPPELEDDGNGIEPRAAFVAGFAVVFVTAVVGSAAAIWINTAYYINIVKDNNT